MTPQLADFSVIETERVPLRAPRLADWPGHATLPENSHAANSGGPYDAVDAWRWLASDLAPCALFGHDTFWIGDRTTRSTLGQTAISNPPLWPEEAFGFIRLDGFEEQGSATEGAEALEQCCCRTDAAAVRLVSHVHPDNDGSVAIMERLEAAPDPDRSCPFEGHDTYLHPAPKVLQ